MRTNAIGRSKHSRRRDYWPALGWSCGLWLCSIASISAAPLNAEPHFSAPIRAFNHDDWHSLKQQSEQATALARQPLASYFAAKHFFPALSGQPLLSPDGRWVYYWRRQGQHYWLCRSQGDGEEQVLHKQRAVPPPRLALSSDLQQLWLAAPDSLQLLDIRRKRLQTLWQAGFALPGQKQVPPRHHVQVIELNSIGAVLRWQQQQTSYWLLKAGYAAQQIWPATDHQAQQTGSRAVWQDAGGNLLFRQSTRQGMPTASSTDAAGLQPEISQVLSRADGKVLATARLYQRLDWQSAEPGWQALLQQLQNLQPDCSMQLQLAATQQKLLVSYFCSDQINAQHQLLTLDPKLNILQRQSLALSASAALSVGVSPQQVAWQAPDGQIIPAYLYVPPGRPLASSPLVTLVHGGPFSRTDPGYDVLVQWLLNHGAIVLQPDYRSSAGFGPAFLQAARGDFGPQSPLLSDIFSGLDQLLANGIGDPTQQLLIGHSFGGYLVIQALQAQPQRFRFGLALAAPVDVAVTLQNYLPKASTPFGQPSLSAMFAAAAVPWQDPQWQQHLSAQSPLARIALLERPFYLWAGGRDDRISAPDIQQFQQLAIAQGKTVRLWLDPTSGHQPATLHSRRLQLYLTASLVIAHLPPAPDAGIAAAQTQQAQSMDQLDSALQAIEVRPELAGN